MSALNQITPSRDAVLAKAVFNAADQLALNQEDLGFVLGIHRSGVSRLKTKNTLDASSKQGELALLLIRFARALYALSGGDKVWIEHFMISPNRITRGVPKEQIKTISGLITVLEFVDAMRGKV